MIGLANVVVDVVIDANRTIGRPVASVGKRLSVAFNIAQPQPAWLIEIDGKPRVAEPDELLQTWELRSSWQFMEEAGSSRSGHCNFIRIQSPRRRVSTLDTYTRSAKLRWSWCLYNWPSKPFTKREDCEFSRNSLAPTLEFTFPVRLILFDLRRTFQSEWPWLVLW